MPACRDSFYIGVGFGVLSMTAGSSNSLRGGFDRRLFRQRHRPHRYWPSFSRFMLRTQVPRVLSAEGVLVLALSIAPVPDDAKMIHLFLVPNTYFRIYVLHNRFEERIPMVDTGSSGGRCRSRATNIFFQCNSSYLFAGVTKILKDDREKGRQEKTSNSEP